MNSNLKLLVFLFILGIHGCKYSTEEIKLETQPAVIESISETFDISASNIEVEEYSLIAKSENIYSGLLKTMYAGERQTFEVEVIWDHSIDEYQVKWELVGSSNEEASTEEASTFTVEEEESAAEIGSGNVDIVESDEWFIGSWKAEVMEGVAIILELKEGGACDMFLSEWINGLNYEKTNSSIDVDWNGTWINFPIDNENKMIYTADGKLFMPLIPSHEQSKATDVYNEAMEEYIEAEAEAVEFPE